MAVVLGAAALCQADPAIKPDGNPGHRLRTADLSLTFHMARYLDGAIGYWPQLIDTLFAIRGRRYPNGWLDEIGLTNHNNYDVAVLLQFGQRRRKGPRLPREMAPKAKHHGEESEGVGQREAAHRGHPCQAQAVPVGAVAPGREVK